MVISSLKGHVPDGQLHALLRMDTGVFLSVAGRLRLLTQRNAVSHSVQNAVLEWRERVVCARCGGRNVDTAVTGTERR